MDNLLRLVVDVTCLGRPAWNTFAQYSSTDLYSIVRCQS